MRVFIITEGSLKNGLGHLNRVKTFVSELKREKEIIIRVAAFISDDLKNIFEDIKEYVDYPQSSSTLQEEIRKFHPDFVIFDLLKIDDKFFKNIKRLKAQTVSLSPIFSNISEVDIVFTRGSLNIPNGPKIFSGLDYVIFGKHVTPIPEDKYKLNLSESQLPIAICMGGTDAPNKVFKILECLVQFDKSLLIWVMLGEGYVHSYTKLVNVIKEKPLHEIILARTNKSMWSILGNTTLSIVSGGLTAYEAAYAGLPTINVLEKEDHIALLSELSDCKATINLGTINELSCNSLLEQIENLFTDRNQLKIIRNNCSKIRIGNGSLNILKKLKELQHEETILNTR